MCEPSQVGITGGFLIFPILAHFHPTRGITFVAQNLCSQSLLFVNVHVNVNYDSLVLTVHKLEVNVHPVDF